MKQRKVFNRYLTPAEDDQLFRTVYRCRDNRLAARDYYWMLILRQTGMRVGNLVTLTTADATAILAHPQNRITLRDADSKRGRGYELRFNKKACTALRALLKIRRQQGYDKDPAAPLIMSRQQGQGLSIRSIQSRMCKWVHAAGLAVNATPHWFRHTKAKAILATTTHHDPVGVVQHALGHADRSSTHVYITPARSDIDEAMDEGGAA